jgi:5-methylcytosine-specific restriction endonuclease McrA
MKKPSTEAYPGQRGTEKRKLFERFRVRVIEDVYRHRFFACFGDKCFKCGRPEKERQEIGTPPALCIDHHVPMFLGGHLVPGNLVSLCRDCNNRKRDKPPTDFYAEHELLRLKPLLEMQEELFRFTFDWDRWQDDRANYLIDVGVHPAVVRTVTTDEDHPHFVGLTTKDAGIGMVISIDLAELLPRSATE